MSTVDAAVTVWPPPSLPFLLRKDGCILSLCLCVFHVKVYYWIAVQNITEKCWVGGGMEGQVRRQNLKFLSLWHCL